MINNSQKVAGSVTLISWRTHLLFWNYHNYNNWRCRGECVYAVVLLALFAVTALVSIETVVITTIVIGLGHSDVEGCSHHCRSRYQDLLFFFAITDVFLCSSKRTFRESLWLMWFRRTRDAEFCNWWWTTSSCYLHCSLFDPEPACCSPPCTLFPKAEHRSEQETPAEFMGVFLQTNSPHYWLITFDSALQLDRLIALTTSGSSAMESEQ